MLLDFLPALEKAPCLCSLLSIPVLAFGPGEFPCSFLRSALSLIFKNTATMNSNYNKNIVAIVTKILAPPRPDIKAVFLDYKIGGKFAKKPSLN